MYCQYDKQWIIGTQSDLDRPLTQYQCMTGKWKKDLDGLSTFTFAGENAMVYAQTAVRSKKALKVVSKISEKEYQTSRVKVIPEPMPPKGSKAIREGDFETMFG